MKSVLSIFAVLALIACDQSQQSATKPSEPMKPTRSVTATSSDPMTFVAENDAVIQTLNVTWKEKNRIDFDFLVKDKKTRKERQLKGSAVSSNQDPEIDEDEEGMAYPAIEFWHKDGSCQFAIRIAMQNASKIQTKAGGCSTGLPLESVAILKRKAV